MRWDNGRRLGLDDLASSSIVSDKQPSRAIAGSFRDGTCRAPPSPDTNLFLDGEMMLNAFTVDVEDYFQVSGFEGDVDRAAWSGFEQRVVRNTHRLLELLARHDVRATFFILGWTADHHPALVRDIVSGGHEIGSHSYWHRLIYRQTPDEFREDVVRSRKTLEDLSGGPVESWRSPSFSITQESLWALEILAEEGFRYDSSVFPIYHDRYGIPNASVEIHEIETPSGTLWEFPVSVVRRMGMNLPVSGGGYFRLYPYGLSQRWLARINERDARPFVFYVHPWEVDPGQPRLRAGSRVGRARHYVNLAATEKKLDRLLSRFEFAPMSEVIRQAVRTEVVEV